MRFQVLILVILLPTSALQAQWLEDEISPEFQDAIDTLSLNSITPILLWKLYLLPKDAVFNYFEYRSAFGGFVDHSELLDIQGLDSTTYLRLKQLPVDPLRTSRNQFSLQSRFSHSTSATHLSLINQFSSAPFSGALISKTSLTQLTPSTHLSGYLKTQHTLGKFPIQLTTHLGHFTLRAGQGLLLGGSGFPAPTTSEYFAHGIRGKTGTSASQVAGGCGAELQWNRHRISLATAPQLTQSCYRFNTTRSEFGFAQNNRDFSAFFKRYQGPWRAYGELATAEQRVGFNYFLGDVLFEANAHRTSTSLWGEHFLSWRNAQGTWIVRSKKGAIRFQWTNGPWDIRLSEHLGAHPEPNTWRWRARYTTHWATLDLHYHSGTVGISMRQQREWGTWTWDWATAWVRGHGQPVWLAVPVSRGSIGALAVYDDFAGLVLRVRTPHLQCSMQWNAMEPSQPRMQLSYLKKIDLKQR